jgi:hypothetical protein
MKKALQLLLSILLLIGFLSIDAAVAQDAEPQDVTIRDLNTYDNLESIDQIEDHPLSGEFVRFTAIVVSNPRTSGLASYNSTETPPIGRIHVFITDTTALNDAQGRDGMSMQIVQGSGTSAFAEVENLNRGDVVTVTGELTFFGGVAQFVVAEVEDNLGNARNQFDGVDAFTPLLDPIDVSPSDFHILTGPNEVDLDLDAYQKYQGAYVRIANGTMANYGGTVADDGVVERPSYTVNKDGSLVANRDIGLRYRNDWADEREGYKEGYNFIRVQDDGYFERPPLGSAVNISGFLVIDDFTNGFSYASGAGFNIAPMEDGILWLTDLSTGDVSRLENGVSDGGSFTWPVDFEFIAAPPQVVDVTLSPDTTTYTSDQTVTVTAIVAAPEDNPSVTTDSVIVSYTTASLGTQRLEMTNTGGDNYSVDLPQLVDFEAPSLFVQAYGSNELAGRFPISGAINFFVDGGSITSIETIQRTGDNLEGPSPITGIEGLTFDITATVVSTAADGVISVQEGTSPWSGVFLALESSTAGLQRGDVVNITGATVQEADIANNAGLGYTYLEDVELTVTSSGADLTTVVPNLTTDEFNIPEAPGEAWEGMLVRFENVRMTEDLGFGEVELTTVADGNLQQGTIALNDDTRAGAIGETGFPNDFNLHARLGNDLSSVTGLVTFTFGVTKIIPRELEDITGDNYTIPRPEFNLVSPADSAEVNVLDVSDIVVDWQSLNPRDYDFDTVTFEWVLYADDLTEVAALPADNDGADSQITISAATVEGVLDDLGVMEGEGITVNWNVRAIDATDTVAVASGFDFDTRESNTIYRALILNRGEVTSNEELGGLPRTFDLEQNYPNPFNPTTQINYAVPEQSDVRIEVYNVIGRRVATLVNREMAPGNYTVNFDASSLSSGMYFYRLKAGSTLLTKKMTLIK